MSNRSGYPCRVAVMAVFVLFFSMSLGQSGAASPDGATEGAAGDLRPITYVVDQQHEAADDDNTGDADAPLRSISEAVRRAKPGDTVLVRPGVYRETVTLERSGRPDAPITLRAEKPGSVVVSGSDHLTDWKDEGNGLWSHNLKDLDPGWDNHFLRTQWVYRDGLPMRPSVLASVKHERETRLKMPIPRIDEPKDVPYASYVIDPDRERVWINLGRKTPIESSRFEIARRQTLIGASQPIDNIVIRGFVLRHAAGWWRGQAALEIRGQNWLVENNSVAWSSARGIELDGTNHCVLRGNRIVWSGQLGVGSRDTANLLFEDNIIDMSNWADHDQWWEAGSTKFSTTIDSVFRNNRMSNAQGSGMWLDVYNGDNLVEGNVISNHPDGMGAFSEISWHDTYHRNVVYNCRWGLVSGQSPGTVFTENLSFNNRVGAQLWGRYNRGNFHGGQRPKLDEFVDRIAAIPGVSDAQVARFRSAMLRYAYAPEFWPLNNCYLERNVIVNNAINLAESRNYSADDPTAPFDNNFSEYNIYWADEEATLFWADEAKRAYAGLEHWQKVSKRDLKSVIVDPNGEDAEERLPGWAMEHASKWRVLRRHHTDVNELNLDLAGGAWSVWLRGQLTIADEVRLYDTGIATTRGVTFRNGEQWYIALWLRGNNRGLVPKPVMMLGGALDQAKQLLPSAVSNANEAVVETPVSLPLVLSHAPFVLKIDDPEAWRFKVIEKDSHE